MLRVQRSRHFSEVIFFHIFFVPHSWRFQRQTSLETLLRGQPYWWSLSSTKMTTGPFSKRRITREKCLRDPLQVGDIDALKGSRGERSCYWISPDSNITLAVIVLRIPALGRASVFHLFFFLLSILSGNFCECVRTCGLFTVVSAQLSSLCDLFSQKRWWRGGSLALNPWCEAKCRQGWTNEQHMWWTPSADVGVKLDIITTTLVTTSF